ncbi:hypothetical protein AL01_05250 [Bombella intestini]|uniref:Uncharacterized protein n=1 Tax=Bombella intestini TaxID=1539051 RepID=A0A1S8GP92_9PROT|nr:hypothetical protein [Bombella intestini]OOL18223.1 hypothetical protein AL01_05250 [Bombella intestini]
MRPEVVTEPVFFWGGLLAGAIWAVLLWMQLPGQPPRPEKLNRSAAIVGLILSGGLAWILWAHVFGVIPAFFCLGGWSMAMLCIVPILWAVLISNQSRTS